MIAQKRVNGSDVSATKITTLSNGMGELKSTVSGYSNLQEVRFRHCDPAGIVFYPRYFDMINDVVEAFFEAVLGYSFVDMHPEHGVPTVKLDVEFKRASRHGDRLLFCLEPKNVGKASLDLHVRAVCDAQTRFIADITLVHIEKPIKSKPWPDSVRHKLISLLEVKHAVGTDG